MDVPGQTALAVGVETGQGPGLTEPLVTESTRQEFLVHFDVPAARLGHAESVSLISD